jgi:hypothetical protein
METLTSSHGCTPAPENVCATSFLYKLRGSSQPSIIRASDGAFYVMKFNRFPGSQSLINEAIGAELIRWFGLPGPSWMRIEITNTFLNDNPGAWFYNERSVFRPHPGLHFGSRLIDAPEDQRTYQLIPHSWIDRIHNRADFLGMLVLDLWTNNCDRRQAVFLSDHNRRLHATFIDNDFMFGGHLGNDITCPRRVMTHDLDIYRGLWDERFLTRWVHKISIIPDDVIREIIEGVPDEWASFQTRQHIFYQLRTRRALLRRLLREAEAVLTSGYSVRYHKPRYATEPSAIPSIQ